MHARSLNTEESHRDKLGDATPPEPALSGSYCQGMPPAKTIAKSSSRKALHKLGMPSKKSAITTYTTQEDSHGNVVVCKGTAAKNNYSIIATGSYKEMTALKSKRAGK